MKAHELIEQDLTGKMVKIEISAGEDSKTFLVSPQYAEWTIDKPEGPQVVLVREHETGGTVDLFFGDQLPQVDGARVTRSEWILPPEFDVELVDAPEIDCLSCDCEDECQQYGGPADSLALDSEHIYTDEDGDELHAEAADVQGPGVVAWTSAACVAVPQADLPTVFNGWLAQAGVSVVDCYVDSDLDGFGSEEKFFGAVHVEGGLTHPAEVAVDLGLECILADMAFLAHVYQLKKSEQVDAVRVGYEQDEEDEEEAQESAGADVVDEYLFAREKALYALRSTYFQLDPDVLGPLTADQRESWSRVLDQAAEIFGAAA